MRLYYIAYRYTDNSFEMIDGPYGCEWEALSEKNSLMEDCPDERLVIVRQVIDVEVIE